jgi:hypothetical protein
VTLRPLCSMSMDSTLFTDMSDVALCMCDVELGMFDVERSVLRTGVRNAQLLYARYWVTYLRYRSDLYLNPCLWYWILEHGEFLNTHVFMIA